jgi:AraC-like DNA-binding protein
VIVVSGYGDPTAAFRAAGMQAETYLAKPFRPRELVEAVSAAFEAARTGVPQPLDELLHALRASGPVPDVAALRALLGRVLGHREVDLTTFVLCARGFRLAVVAPRRFVRAAPLFRERLEQHLAWPEPPGSPVSGIVHEIEESVRSGGRPTEQAVAAAVGVHVTSVPRLLARIGVNFRECRSAARLRPATCALAVADEYVSQVAYATGYSDHTQFDREFKRAFGLSPRGFRQLLET